MAYKSETQETRHQLKIEKNQQISTQEYWAYIRICINFDISSDVFVLQLGVDISHKQFTFPGSWWGNSLKQKKQINILQIEVKMILT